MFNDDVQVSSPHFTSAASTLKLLFNNKQCWRMISQGTAGVALAGLLGTVRAQGRPLSDFVNQKIVVVGAGRYSVIHFKSLLLMYYYFCSNFHLIFVL